MTPEEFYPVHPEIQVNVIEPWDDLLWPAAWLEPGQVVEMHHPPGYRAPWWKLHWEPLVALLAALAGLMDYILDRPWIVSALLVLIGYLWLAFLWKP